MQAIRTLRQRPGLSVAVILLLGFGIGANTALFSVLRQVLLRPIPGVERSGELINVMRTLNGKMQTNQSYPDYLDLRDQAKTLDGVVAERLGTARLAGPPSRFVAAAIVTGNYFQVLGVKPYAGRLLSPDDNRVPGGHPVVVVSEKFWREQFHADPSILGRTLVLNGYPFSIAGVAAAPFAGVEFGEETEVWMPMMMVRYFMTRSPDYHFLSERRAGWLTFYGRKRAGIPIATLQAELTTIAGQLEARYPASNSGRSFHVNAHAGMTPGQRSDLRSLLGMLTAAVCLVLLIACGNIATLLLARAAGQGREMAVRLALGASRWILVKQLFAQNLLLATIGGILGLVLAPWMVTVLRKLIVTPEANSGSAGILDPQVLAFTAGICLLAVLLFGLAPALAASQADAGVALREAGARTSSAGSRLQHPWVIAQVTLSVALVAAGSLVLRSMQRVLAIDPGYQAGQVMTCTMDLSLVGYSSERGMQFYLDLVDRAGQLPGVRSASLAKSSPAIDWSDRVVLRHGDGATVTVDRNIIAPNYFRTLGIPLRAGRDFDRTDAGSSRKIAIVSQALADRMWPNQDPLGKQLLQPIEGQRLTTAFEVIGVAADSRYRSVLEAPPLLIYVPLTQNYDSIARVMIAVDGPVSRFKSELPRLIQQASPDLPTRGASTLQEQTDRSLWRMRAAASLLALFGALAIALACAGIYGVVAYAVARRVREIGIRMALGAGRVHVVWQVVGQAVRLTLMGIVLGVPLALWSKPALESVLYGANGIDAIAVTGVPLLFVLVAVAASYFPARRAAAVDPSIALRQDC